MKDLREDLLHHAHIGNERTEHDGHRQGVAQRLRLPSTKRTAPTM
jgi:hypothetical protein